MQTHDPASSRSHIPVLTVVLAYAILSAVWILTSDRVVEWLVKDPALIVTIGTLKGWLFVAITSLLLYKLLRRGNASVDAPTVGMPVSARPSRLALALVSALIVAVTAGTVLHDFKRHRDAGVARLTTVAGLKTQQVADWLGERRGDLGFLSSSRLLSNLYRQWQERGDSDSRDQLLGRLEQFRLNKGYQSALLFDGEGRAWDSAAGVATVVDPALSAVARATATTGQIKPIASFSDAEGNVQLYVLAPLANAKRNPLPVIALRIDPATYLFPMLETWPTPSASAETLLFRSEGERIVYLGQMRNRNHGGAPATLNLSLATPRLLEARALRGEAEQGGLVEGDDYQSVPSIGVSRAVPETDWFVIAKIGRTELYEAAWRDGLWTTLAGLLLLFMAIAGRLLFRQRQHLDEISRQREFEAEKLHALELLDALAESSDDCMFVKDNEGRYLLFNRAACDAVGKTQAEVLGHDDSEVFLPADAEAVMATDRRIRSENTRWTGEETLITPKGTRVFFASKGPLHDEQGKVIGSFGISRDITERIQLERDLQTTAAILKENLSRTQLLLDSALDAVICMDQEGRVLVWNARAEAIFGYSEVQAMGRTIAELIVPPAFRERHTQGMARFMKTGQPMVIGKRLELLGMRADGTEFPIELTIGSLWQNGIPLFSAYVRDITERKRDEDALRKLSLAVEQSPESIVITNIDAKIEYVNQAFIRTTGYSREDVIGQNPKMLHSGKTPPETYVGMWDALAKGEPWKGEFHNRRKDGSEYIEFAILTPIRQADGRVSHYVAVKEDITEKKRIGQELDQHRHHLEELVASRTTELEEARERAEVANLAKSTFLANMSHEIRTPMNAIIGLTHLLRSAGPSPEQADKLGKISGAAEHLLSIINDILDLSKIEAGKLTLEQTDFSLSAILDNTRSLIAEQAQAKGLDIEVDTDGVPSWLRGDPTRLRQTLLNFAGNAVKFTESGRIVLRARLLGSDGDDLRIRFEVEDTGIGIPAAQIDGLFQIFSQADASTTRKYGGTGLGLAISRRLAGLMGGEAGVESESGRGSTFWFTARLQRGHGPQSTSVGSAAGIGDAEAELRQRHGGALLLLAEDNEINREVALELIHAAGLDVDIAENGREAVDKAAATAYDLILMDVQMPLMNGLEATRAIRALADRKATPILALTANAFEEDRNACKEAGMDDFVAKPVDPRMFYAALLKWLPERAAAPAVAPPPAAPVAPVADDQQRQRLDAIPGLDVGQGMAMIRNNVAKYAQLLSMFADRNAQHVDKIMRLVAAGDLQAMRPLAHGLRGSAGMLGAQAVSEAAAAVTAAFHDGEGAERIGQLCSVLSGELSALIGGIRQAVAAEAEPAAAANGPQLMEVLARLEALLQQGDMAAGDFARDNATLLRRGLGKSAASLMARIDAFDYEKAAADLHELRRGAGATNPAT